ncbi:MAG: cupin domain-containing protein [Paracoccaceae bacterium]
MIVDPSTAPVSGENGVSTLHLSVAGGLTQFGAYIDTLVPGAYSSHRHWHEAEDEFIYVLEGTATVIDDNGAHMLTPGDAACWRHGDPNAHHVTNRSNVPCRYVIAGSRVAGDICHYPDSGWRMVNDATRWAVYNATGVMEREGDLPAELLNLPPVWGTPFDPATKARRILRKGSVAPVTSTATPGGFNDLGDYQAFPISDAGGLSQFGAFTETLMPGARSSERHWHAAEDEFLYVLEGLVTLVEDGAPQDLRPGDVVCWPAGTPVGHQLHNRTPTPVHYLVIGTRSQDDVIHYPDRDLIVHKHGPARQYFHADGRIREKP